LTYSFFERGMGLQRLGKVMSVTPSQNLVVRTGKAPKIGAAVVDENLKVIGKVFDVIGPVSSPYAIIRPIVKQPEQLSNRQLYLLLSKRNRSKE